MSPQELNHLDKRLTAETIVTPEIPKATIRQIAEAPDADKRAESLAQNLMSGLNQLSVIAGMRDALTMRVATLTNGYRKANRRLMRVDSHSADPSNEKEFTLARVIQDAVLIATAAVMFGIVILLNTVSALITGSGEMPSLVDSPIRAAAFAVLPVGAMITTHIVSARSITDTPKRIIGWTSDTIVIVSALTWCICFVFAFPAGSAASFVPANILAAGTAVAPTNHWLTGLMYVQLVGEIAFGGSTAIYLEHVRTRGRTVRITPSANHVAYDEHQRDLLSERADCERLLGRIADHERQYQAAQNAFVASVLAYLDEVRLRLVIVKSTAVLTVIRDRDLSV